MGGSVPLHDDEQVPALQATKPRRGLRDRWEGYTAFVRLARQIGLLALLLVSYVAPAMACMRVNAQMTAPERACCRMMKGQCGGMEMPASHGCCHKTVSTPGDHALPVSTAALHPVMEVGVLFATTILPADVNSVIWIQAPPHSPPKSTPLSVSILRI
jgi:hypothetical protein